MAKGAYTASPKSVHAELMNSFLSTVALYLIAITAAVASAPTTFEKAKVVAKKQVFYDQANSSAGDLYCGCKWTWVGKSGGRVDALSCGYEVRKQASRAKRTEWEHIVPAWTFGHQRKCWQQGGRKNCAATDQVFRTMEADLFNLYPAVGEVNGDRSNFNYGMTSGVSAQYGACQTRIDFGSRTAEPRNEVKGLVARTTFYMFDRYNLNMSRQQQQLLMAWSKQYPATTWERKRNDRIAQIVEYSNPFVTGERVWTLGYKPAGEGVSQARPSPTIKQAAQIKSISAAGPIIGNRNSHVYHLPSGCPSYGSVSTKNKVPFSSESEALAARYRKAGNCK
jgi:deoxyribonuclease-1